ncbi:PssE/Cps14G family polysaccharide biosynthesis glycosyltransferase [Butyrivibrio sp. VCB2006]|uniref:PssE/Cps14G family polysaccharide biosynthesis glycosyltransferase n=1 Tax=Butyrivibrio sp. VCB2006 TaxID=1280679 RepID=UPI0024187E35|nr:PssE/Cps14G family polysaccharide biosynthesis glycosyltransferase [Butyrivibrio sp. VCB2006]
MGTQKFQMNRLVKAVDELAAQMTEEIFVQRGWSDYTPTNCGYTDFMDVDEYNKKIAECSVLITHAGVGTIISGINAKRPIVVVPRKNKYAEHVDDHQCQIANAFSSKGCVLCCEEVTELKDYIDKARTFDFKPYELKGGNIEETIMRFINIFD